MSEPLSKTKNKTSICISILINESNTIVSVGFPGCSSPPLIRVVESLALPPEIEGLVNQFREEFPTLLEKSQQRQTSNQPIKHKVEAPTIDHQSSENQYQQMNLLEGLS